MFGLGNKRRPARSDTFSSNRIRGAALAGLGMLAWQWWRKRQGSSQPGNNPGRPYTDRSKTPTADAF